MKKNKIRTMFYTLLALTSVFLFAEVQLKNVPIQSFVEAENYDETEDHVISSDFRYVKGEYAENYAKDQYVFPNINCSVYRFPQRKGDCPNEISLLSKVYNGYHIINEIEPLPGSLSNLTPIKGIKRIVATFEGSGMLRIDDRADFRHNYSHALVRGSIDITFKPEYAGAKFYPAYFRFETYEGSTLKLLSITITHNYALGKVNNTPCPSGYGYHRLPSPFGKKTTMPESVKFDDSFSSYVETGSIEYPYYRGQRTLTDAVNSIALNGAQSEALKMHNQYGYSRNDGYVLAFGGYYVQDQTYFEFDVRNDNSDGRGACRVVLFPKGLKATGYENEPLIVFTDDHYFTFREFLNYSIDGKAIFGPRFNTDCLMTGYRWSPSTTVGVSGSGTTHGPDSVEPKVKIYPETFGRVSNGEVIEFEYDLENAYALGYRITFEAINEVKKNPSDTELFVGKCKNDGHFWSNSTYCPGTIEVRAKATKQNRPTLYSNVVKITVAKRQSLEIIGTPQKQFYEGALFNPNGIEVFAIYDDGYREKIDPLDCEWLDPTTNSPELSIGQTTISCKYKKLQGQLGGFEVIPRPALERMELTQNTSVILTNSKINLDVVAYPYGSSRDCIWNLAYERDGTPPPASIYNDVLTTYTKNAYIHVYGYGSGTKIKVQQYFSIRDYESFDQILTIDDLERGEYVLVSSDKYAYDPSIKGIDNAHTVPGKYEITNPKIGTKLIISKSQTNENFYTLQRTDNNMYVGFDPISNSILENSIYPLDVEIIIDGLYQAIKNPANENTLQFDSVTKKFGSFPKGSKTNINILKEAYTGFETIACDGFAGIYLHMNDYNENLGYCKDFDHNYYKKAKSEFYDLTNKERLFMTTREQYKPAWDRLQEWARNNDDKIIVDDMGNVTSTKLGATIKTYKHNNTLVIVVSASIITGITIFAFILMQRKSIKRYKRH